MSVRDQVSRLLAASPLAYFPVRVRKGPAKGARWTAFPFSANWRHGGNEHDIEAALRYFPTVEGISFWDFGAHFGIHTVGIAMLAGPSAQVVAFEPDPGAFIRLKRHVRMNALDNVILLNAAASSTEGISKLYIPGRMGSSCSHFQYYPENDMTGLPWISVQTVTADRLVDRGEIREPDLIKIDVQGHGAQAVAGAIKSIAAKLPIIAFSNHSPAELSGVRQHLEPLGYSPVNLEGSNISWDHAHEAILLPPRQSHS
jgi:FkbM family methyltransferase